MRLWTVLLSLVVAATLTVSASAQEKKGGRSGHPRMSFADMDVSPKDGVLTKAEFLAARLKDVPEEQKAKATERAESRWKGLAGDKDKLTEAEFKAAIEKMMKEHQDKGGKGRGAKNENK